MGSYNFVDRIGYAVVKMCEIEKSRLFKAEHFPSFNPEPILMRGSGILCQGLKRVHKLVMFVGLSPFYRFTFINLESYPAELGIIDCNPRNYIAADCDGAIVNLFIIFLRDEIMGSMP